jgi:hypothetical protein
MTRAPDEPYGAEPEVLMFPRLGSLVLVFLHGATGERSTRPTICSGSYRAQVSRRGGAQLRATGDDRADAADHPRWCPQATPAPFRGDPRRTWWFCHRPVAICAMLLACRWFRLIADLPRPVSAAMGRSRALLIWNRCARHLLCS